MTVDFDRRDLMKALVTLSVEKVLLKMGKPVLEKVSNKLQKEYKCYIPDCYEHPEYLESVIKSLYGNAHRIILDEIKNELVEYLDDSGMRILVKTIAR